MPSTVPGSGPPLRDRKDGISLPTAATESQAWGALGGLSAPVLYLTDAAGAFCSFDSTKANAAFDAEMGYALNNSWCCARSGGVQFDLPEPLSASHQRTTESVAGDGAGAGAGGGGGSAAEASGEEQVGGTGRGLCVPKAPPGAYPSVLRALELQQARFLAHFLRRPSSSAGGGSGAAERPCCSMETICLRRPELCALSHAGLQGRPHVLDGLQEPPQGARCGSWPEVCLATTARRRSSCSDDDRGRSSSGREPH